MASPQIDWNVEEDRNRIHKYDKDGKEYRITFTDPYNFATISTLVGRTPKALTESVYTTLEDAHHAIDRYTHSQVKNIDAQTSWHKY